MTLMSRPRKLSPAAETALIAWYADYQRALRRYRRALRALRKCGTVRDQAHRHGISMRAVHLIAKRDEYELHRKCKLAGLDLHSAS
jgi:hypothetical protein